MSKSSYVLALLLAACSPLCAFADDCPEGQREGAYADGNNLSTTCVESEAAMAETVADPNVQEVNDPTNYD